VNRRLRYWIAGGAAVVALSATAVAISVTSGGGHAPRNPVQSASVGPAHSSYEKTVDAAHGEGLRVWIEADLVKRWLAGPDSFKGAVATIGSLANRPGVIGIKIADEMGYKDGLDSPEKINAVLSDSSQALRRVAPGKQLLVDMIIPEMGCLPEYAPPLRWATICAAQQRGQFPQLALDQVDEYLKNHYIDVLNLSTGLLTAKTYQGWGVDMDVAQNTAWKEVHRRGWDLHVKLQSRKALAHPGPYTATDTATTLTTFVDIPREKGAAAIDVWTWRQMYQGQVYRLLDPGLKPNALWNALVTRRANGAVLFTHLSPSSLEVGLDADLRLLAQVFTDLFVAAGTG
jgi:hypothetical protein